MSREEKYYWSPQDIADEIGTDKNGLLYVTRQTVRNWFVKNEVPKGKRRGKQWRARRTKKLLDFCADKRRKFAAKPIFQGPRPAFSRDFPFINDFWKWDQAVKNGQARLPSVEKLRHSFRRMLADISKLCGGLDWVRRES